MTTFAELGLSPEVLRAIEDVGYTAPTPIQEQAVPWILQMRDVLGCAQTGTGKTAGFTLPMIEILAQGRARARMPRSLILEPTRELATQVADNFLTYGKYHKLTMALLIGGEQMDAQIRNLDRGVDVLIATPGRMLDLHERGKIMLNDIRIFVIDEADRMLDMGFIPDVEKIASLLPPLRQTLFFSATMPPEIRRLADRFLKNPKSVTVSPPASAATTIRQVMVTLPSGNDWQKREALRLLMRRETPQNAFIFCNRKRDVALLHKSLQRHGFNAGALHGDMDQSSRTATLDAFRNGTIAFLVCSDVAARGLDVPDVTHVFNFDVPFNAEDYVHRIGRTGRAGKAGTAYSLATPNDAEQVAAIEKLIRQPIARETLADLPEPDPSARPPRDESSRHGPRSRRGGRQHGTADAKHRREHPRKSAGHPQHREPPAPREASREAPPVREAAKKSHGGGPSRHAPPRRHEIHAEGPRGFGNDLPAFLRQPPTKGRSR